MNQIPAGLSAEMDRIRHELLRLADLVNTKADKSVVENLTTGIIYKGKVATPGLLPADPDAVKTGHAYIVESETDPHGYAYIFQAEVCGEPPAVVWSNTFLTVLTSDVFSLENQRNPVNEIRYSTALAGNIFGDKYLKCDGAGVAKDDYPLLRLPEGLIAFRAEKNATIPQTFRALAVLYANGKYVIGGYYDYLYTGSSLTALTQKSIGGYTNKFGGSSGCLRYLNGRFYALSDKIKSFAWSDDGDAWTAVRLDAFQGIVSTNSIPVRDAAYGNGLYVFVGNNANIAVSSDGMSFGKQSTNLNVNSPFFSIAFGNGIFVALGGSIGAMVKPTLFTSTGSDGWTNRGATPLYDCYEVKFIDSHFVLLSNAGVAFSDDGIEWTTGDEQARGFHAFGGGIYIRIESYLSEIGTTAVHIKASADSNLVEWVNVMDIPSSVDDIIYDGTQFVFVGNGIYPHISADAIKLPLIENAWIKAIE